MLTRLAVTYLCRRLKKDPGYWAAWQANIAMSFYDVAIKELNTVKQSDTDYNFATQLDRVSNQAANKFLALLTLSSLL